MSDGEHTAIDVAARTDGSRPGKAMDQKIPGRRPEGFETAMRYAGLRDPILLDPLDDMQVQDVDDLIRQRAARARAGEEWKSWQQALAKVQMNALKFGAARQQ